MEGTLISRQPYRFQLDNRMVGEYLSMTDPAVVIGMSEENTYEKCKVRWLTDEECALCLAWNMKLGKDIFDREKGEDGYVHLTKDQPFKGGE